MDNANNIRTLYNRYLNNELSKDELAIFLQLANDPVTEMELNKCLDGTWQEMFSDDEKEEAKVVPIKTYNRSWIAAAAVIFLLLSAGAYFLSNRKDESQIAKTAKPIQNDVAPPQGNRAMLTLADGTTIALDSAGSGSISMQGNVNVIKTADGQIVYKGDDAEVKFNTLTVPRGSKPVQLQLADGSQVWLNVESSITYPTAFINKERKVQVSGEVYFEVKHNDAMPFTVESNDLMVKVLGTHFNVNTYDNEKALKVTLLEGSVMVNKGQASGLLKPGQQARLTGNELKVVTDVDLDEVLAWKNGLFNFNSLQIPEIMKQIARWYDVDVKYEGQSSKKHFSGIVDRNSNVSEILKIMEMSGIKFRIEDKKITVVQ